VVQEEKQGDRGCHRSRRQRRQRRPPEQVHQRAFDRRRSDQKEVCVFVMFIIVRLLIGFLAEVDPQCTLA
jgi:hypothetical protein